LQACVNLQSREFGKQKRKMTAMLSWPVHQNEQRMITFLLFQNWYKKNFGEETESHVVTWSWAGEASG
jgi:hypothetical protein